MLLDLINKLDRKISSEVIGGDRENSASGARSSTLLRETEKRNSGGKRKPSSDNNRFYGCSCGEP